MNHCEMSVTTLYSLFINSVQNQGGSGAMQAPQKNVKPLQTSSI